MDTILHSASKGGASLNLLAVLRIVIQMFADQEICDSRIRADPERRDEDPTGDDGNRTPARIRMANPKPWP